MGKKRINLVVILVFLLTCCSIYAAESEITVYSMPGCSPCKSLKKYLDEKNVLYKERDITKDLSARKEIQKKSGQMGVPVLDWEGTIIIGFGPKTKPIIDNLIREYSSQTSQDAGQVNSSSSGQRRNSAARKENRVSRTRRANRAGGADKNVANDNLLSSSHREVENLKMVFERARQDTGSEEAAAVLEKCFKANEARLVYKVCQKREGEFLAVVNRGFFGVMKEQKDRVIRIAEIIACENYKDTLAEFQKALSENPRAATEAREVLRKVTARENFVKSADELWLYQSEKYPVSSLPQSQRREVALSSDSEIKEIDVIKAEAIRALKELVSPDELYLSSNEKYKYEGEYSYWYLRPTVDGLPPLLFKTRRSYDSGKLTAELRKNPWYGRYGWRTVPEEKYLRLKEIQKMWIKVHPEEASARGWIKVHPEEASARGMRIPMKTPGISIDVYQGSSYIERQRSFDEIEKITETEDTSEKPIISKMD